MRFPFSSSVLCSVALCCLFVYTYDSNFIAGVPSRWQSTDHPITAHHSGSSAFPNIKEGFAEWGLNQLNPKTHVY